MNIVLPPYSCVYVLVFNTSSITYFNAFRLATTQIAYMNFHLAIFRNFNRKYGLVWTGIHTHFAHNALVLINFHCSCIFIF